MSTSLFATEPFADPVATASRLALPPRPGHFDEMRADDGALRPLWTGFFEWLGGQGFSDLDRRLDAVERQIRENGITYNVYADPGGSQRPWSLDLLPFIISQAEWAELSAGVAQRAELLNRLVADVYGPQSLLHEGLLPPALINGHPGFMRALSHYVPPAGVHLHLVAFDLARAPDGAWWVVSQRVQAPSGLGYVLENRLTISRLFPEAFRGEQIQHLASSYRRLLDLLVRLAPGTDSNKRVVLLTPGPYNETYFEHAYLARYLGVPLVEGSDLTVRNNQLFLKTLYGLERVHAVLRRLDDDFLDPLELRADSTLGVPGLLQAVRAGNVLIANAPGASFLESPAINGFLPAISHRLMKQELLLPSLSTWWCGEDAARAQILPYLPELVVKPTYPTLTFEPLIGTHASPGDLEAWRARIEADPAAYTVQAYVPLSQAPTWSAGRIVPRPAMVRLFAIAGEDGSYHVLPGGLTRIASLDQQVVSMQRGGSSLDTWVESRDHVDNFTMLPEHLHPQDLAHKRRPVSSRAAENLFWMGRYAERADNAVRLSRLVLTALSADDSSPPVMNEVLRQLCVLRGLISETTVAPVPGLRADFERTLIERLSDARSATSVGFDIYALAHAAGQIRDRLSPSHWRLILAAGDEFFARLSVRGETATALETVPALEHLAMQLSAVTGAQTDRMTRDDGWRLLTVGRQIERLSTMSSTLWVLFSSGALAEEQGFDLLLELFDSIITYRAHYQRRHEVPALLDLLVMDDENPRSLACIVSALRQHLAHLPAVQSGAAPTELVAHLPLAGVGANLTDLCEQGPDGAWRAVESLAARFSSIARVISDDIGRRYFSHVAERDRSLAA